MNWGERERQNNEKTGKKCRTKNGVRRVLPDAPDAIKSGKLWAGSGVREKPRHKRHGVMLFGGWLKNLPYLNLIENLWAQMKHKQRKEQATSAERLKRIARKVWKGISSEYLKKIYKSMPRRMQAVIDAKGSHTKY